MYICICCGERAGRGKTRADKWQGGAGAYG